MKLLFLTPQLPHPPRQGTALRNWGLLSHLAARGHTITLLSFDEAPGTALSPELRAACAKLVRVPVPRRSTQQRLKTLATSALPDMAWRLWSAEFAGQLHALLRTDPPDILQIEGIELARYAFDPAARAAHTRLVFDDHNCEYVLQRRAFETDARRPRRWHAAAYSLAQWRRLRQFESDILKRADATLCVSEQDRDALRTLVPDARPHVIYNGIDVAAMRSPEAASDEPTLVFTGKMDFRPNIDAALWFADAIFPAVRAAHPQAKLMIVGQKPAARLDRLRTDPAITLTGAVDDIRSYIAGATVYVAPLLAGGGTRFKLLEAMAMRKAIVSTRLGAEGFAVHSGREMMLADDAAGFASAINALIADDAQRSAMGAAAHAFVSATYDWRAIVPKLETVYHNLCRA